MTNQEDQSGQGDSVQPEEQEVGNARPNEATEEPEPTMGDVRDQWKETGTQMGRHAKEFLKFAAPVVADRALNAAFSGLRKYLERRRKGREQTSKSADKAAV